MITICDSGSTKVLLQVIRDAFAPAGIGTCSWRALQVGKLIWTVTRGVELDATQTDGVDTAVGPMQLAQRSLIAWIKLLLFEAIETSLGIGVFQGLLALYQLSNTVEA